MRPGQNKRMRGRPTNNRRGPNPLTRSYELNGPDVKIRGNAHHIAEKYLQLARDAHTSGDPVAAENYLQHAEHYYRLIAAAQAAQLAAQGRAPGEAEAEDADDDDDGGVLDRFASPAERAPIYNPQNPSFAPQPTPNAGAFGYGERQPFESDRPAPGDRNAFQQRGEFQPRGDRPQPIRHDGRPPRNGFNERGDNAQRENRSGPDGRPARDFRNYREMNPPREPQPPVDMPAGGLPPFITAAPRLPTPAESLDAPQPVVDVPAQASEVPETPAASAEEVAQEARFPKGRRRRLRSPFGFHAGSEDANNAPNSSESGSNSE